VTTSFTNGANHARKITDKILYEDDKKEIPQKLLISFLSHSLAP
jgi:hypothetical protein